ncbi:hypothetical protein SAMN05444166_6671 [Singulisphaera sp. GP187]|uniref:hypothetical protein n=1 Tax=Singulisphaera sp. GP187 TaxID=1882752 RepID=UPI0009294B19|nr:hypothetical protein [Singulisphaera sp. GP187]SIO61186.1 hypothetical protein SAMN05444166_6671 [Singulisphaera sp. GP187]
MGLGPLLIIVILTIGGDAPLPPETAADEITLRDGQVLHGQVVEPAPRGTLVVLIRRAWAEAELPDWYARWKSVEAPSLRRARAQRLDRLSAWRRSRAPFANADDAILAWIDREVARLSVQKPSSESTLMSVKLNRGEVRSVVRRPRSSARLLQLGWRSGFPRVETMPLDRLVESLEGRGFAAEGVAPVSLDRLLPEPVETETQWTTRRAATEVATDPGLKFVRTGSVLLPEPEPGQPLAVGGALSALSDLTRLLEDRATDPLAEALGKIAARGRIGALVTQLEISPDLTAVRVQSTLWVRRAERWLPAGSRNALVRPDALAANAGAPLAEDPQVKGLFNLVESIGLGQVSDDVKKRSLNIGAATQKALGQVRSMMLEELNGLVLPVNEAPGSEVEP